MDKLEDLLAQIRALNNSDEFKKVIDLLPEEILTKYQNADLYVEKSQSCWRIKEYDLCEDCAKKALSLNPENAKAHYYLGNCYRRSSKDKKAALRAYQNSIKFNPSNSYSHYGLGNVYYDLKDYDKAIEEYKKSIDLDPKYSYPHYALGNIYYDLKDYDKAIEEYKESITLDPKYSYPHYALGNIYYDLKDYDKAIEEYEKSIDLDPRYPSPYNGLGNAYRELKNHDKASEAYEKSILLDPALAHPHNGLGNVYRDLKDYDKAIEEYKKSIDLGPELPHPHNGLGNVYYDLKDYDKAIEEYKKSITLDPEYLFPYTNLGNVYNSLGQKEKAINFYTQAISHSPNNANPYYNRAGTYFTLKEYRESLLDYEKYVELTRHTSDYFTSVSKSRITEIEELLGDVDKLTITELINKIKNLLLFNEESLTHYTSLTATKKLVLHESLFQLSEGAYLNDTSEGRDLFKYLDFQVTLSREDDTIAEPFTKKPFIGSFVAVEKCNDLTLWRMYGKEAKEEGVGCSLTILRNDFLENLKNELTKNSKSDSLSKSDEEFKFYRVAYRSAETKGNFIIPGARELDERFNKIMEELKDKLAVFVKKKDNKNTDTKKSAEELLNNIAYLFKTADYQYENEIRLVTTGAGFPLKINTERTPPKAFIELIPIPPVIKKIILGPKVDRPDEWAAAFHYHFKEKGLPTPEIFISHLPYK